MFFFFELSQSDPIVLKEGFAFLGATVHRSRHVGECHPLVASTTDDPMYLSQPLSNWIDPLVRQGGAFRSLENTFPRSAELSRASSWGGLQLVLGKRHIIHILFFGIFEWSKWRWVKKGYLKIPIG